MSFCVSFISRKHTPEDVYKQLFFFLAFNNVVGHNLKITYEKRITLSIHVFNGNDVFPDTFVIRAERILLREVNKKIDMCS